MMLLCLVVVVVALLRIFLVFQSAVSESLLFLCDAKKITAATKIARKSVEKY